MRVGCVSVCVVLIVDLSNILENYVAAFSLSKKWFVYIAHYKRVINTEFTPYDAV